MKLSNILLELDFDKYKEEEAELAREINTKFGITPYVRMGDYSSGREDNDPLKDKGHGSVSFKVKSEFEENEWKDVINFIKNKGYEIRQESNYYDIEPGEREWFPKIDFIFNSK